MNNCTPHYDGIAWWWFTDRAGMGEGALPHAVFVRLSGGEFEWTVGGRYYSTREEAMQSLAQAKAVVSA